MHVPDESAEAREWALYIAEILTVILTYVDNIDVRAVSPRWRDVHDRHVPVSVRGIKALKLLTKMRVHTLNLSECTAVTDVSALGGVHTLNLFGCTAVTDVSALGGVHTLDLARCTAVTDVSALGGVHTLNLARCTAVTDVSALG